MRLNLFWPILLVIFLASFNNVHLIESSDQEKSVYYYYDDFLNDTNSDETQNQLVKSEILEKPSSNNLNENEQSFNINTIQLTATNTTRLNNNDENEQSFNNNTIQLKATNTTRLNNNDENDNIDYMDDEEVKSAKENNNNNNNQKKSEDDELLDFIESINENEQDGKDVIENKDKDEDEDEDEDEEEKTTIKKLSIEDTQDSSELINNTNNLGAVVDKNKTENGFNILYVIVPFAIAVVVFLVVGLTIILRKRENKKQEKNKRAPIYKNDQYNKVPVSEPHQV